MARPTFTIWGNHLCVYGGREFSIPEGGTLSFNPWRNGNEARQMGIVNLPRRGLSYSSQTKSIAEGVTFEVSLDGGDYHTMTGEPPSFTFTGW